MLRRVRAEAKRRDLDRIEFIEADVEALPFEDTSFDLCVSYTGLHCFPNPGGGDLGDRARPAPARRAAGHHDRPELCQDAFVRLCQAAGVFGPSGTSDELEAWLTDAGMLDVSARSDGALAYFSARRNPEHA